MPSLKPVVSLVLGQLPTTLTDTPPRPAVESSRSPPNTFTFESTAHSLCVCPTYIQSCISPHYLYLSSSRVTQVLSPAAFPSSPYTSLMPYLSQLSTETRPCPLYLRIRTLHINPLSASSKARQKTVLPPFRLRAYRSEERRVGKEC